MCERAEIYLRVWVCVENFMQTNLPHRWLREGNGGRRMTATMTTTSGRVQQRSHTVHNVNVHICAQLSKLFKWISNGWNITLDRLKLTNDRRKVKILSYIDNNLYHSHTCMHGVLVSIYSNRDKGLWFEMNRRQNREILQCHQACEPWISMHIAYTIFG